MKTISCMNIDESLLYSMSAEDRNYKKRESVFKKKDSRIIRLSKNIFFEMTDVNPYLSMEVNACLSQEIYYTLKMGQSLASENAVRRLKGLPDYLKSYHHEDCLKYSTLNWQDNRLSILRTCIWKMYSGLLKR
ncbi:hypothetical protein [Chryseobacterium sp.]|uniref:hypothetical protein n=1 Tax=Chryseobacterium sp. TaxID=1871047 RepID=UPI0031D36A43